MLDSVLWCSKTCLSLKDRLVALSDRVLISFSDRVRFFSSISSILIHDRRQPR
jgi:hypothetical protein